MRTIKEEMARYWSCRAEKFSALRQREFACEKHGQWMAELDRHLAGGKALNILDIGTGTGFLAFLLAERGHKVTGIDLSPDMINEARQIAKRMGFPVSFFVMDAEKPDFPRKSFDAIVTRRLTWALPNLPAAYQAWHGLLKPGGILVNFDADYCREKPSAALPPHHAHEDVAESLMQAYERMKNVLKSRQLERPMWDEELLRQAGFSNVTVDYGVWKRIYSEMDEFYDPAQGFAIVATA